MTDTTPPLPSDGPPPSDGTLPPSGTTPAPSATLPPPSPGPRPSGEPRQLRWMVRLLAIALLAYGVVSLVMALVGGVHAERRLI